MRKGLVRVALFGLSLLWLLCVGLNLTACGKKEEDPAAQGYYEGPMLPKSQRTGSTPAQGTTE
ncbi:MAG: hypothetical protein RMM06_05930 [Armatimonadota bacterium]|nr:hypothetical protein [bacterium]MCS7310548.1 hypothetical protein [Armatimonadota bacterium]MDW8290242.1 hypothetical protein [Armatimonadota bacterium]